MAMMRATTPAGMPSSTSLLTIGPFGGIGSTVDDVTVCSVVSRVVSVAGSVTVVGAVDDDVMGVVLLLTTVDSVVNAVLDVFMVVVVDDVGLAEKLSFFYFFLFFNKYDSYS